MYNVAFFNHRKELSDVGYSFEDDFEQVSSFLHENGVLLHYDDSSLLHELYFINPQWLCKTVAKIITIGHVNPYSSKGVCIKVLTF